MALIWSIKQRTIKYQQGLIMLKIGKLTDQHYYSFDGPFQLTHADVANLEFLGKSATIPCSALLIVDLHSL